jgi:dihydropteroate synthase
MGIINITPDSFYDGGIYNNEYLILKKAEQHIEEGAKILDLGAFSSRPGAHLVAEKEELKRLLPTIKALLKTNPGLLISVDTYRSNVARAAVEEGVFMINDISGGTLDDSLFSVIGKYNVPYVLMHMRGTPSTMQDLTKYEHLVEEVYTELENKIKTLKIKGAEQIIIDPGFGFAKTLSQNYHLLKKLSKFKQLEAPLLVGLSRKSMIYKKLNISAKEALNGTTVLNTIALSLGAKILRVHDVKEAREAILLTQNLIN